VLALLETPDISWFDLRKYDGLSELDLIGWFDQIHIRTLLLEAIDINQDFIIETVGRIKESPILSSAFKNRDLGLSTITSTTAYEHWVITSDTRFDNVWDCCRLKYSNHATEVHRELSEASALTLHKSINLDSSQMTHITANLLATDEQLINDFKVWLSEQRTATQAKPTKNNFTDSTMKGWVKDRLLPYIDLVIFNDYYRLGLTQVDIANHIHSDDVKADVVDKTRRTTRPKALKLFTYDIVEQLYIQISCMAVKD
jgi:hypothetical protein